MSTWWLSEPQPSEGPQTAGTHQGAGLGWASLGRQPPAPDVPNKQVALSSLARGTIDGPVPRMREHKISFQAPMLLWFSFPSFVEM